MDKYYFLILSTSKKELVSDLVGSSMGCIISDLVLVLLIVAEKEEFGKGVSTRQQWVFKFGGLD